MMSELRASIAADWFDLERATFLGSYMDEQPINVLEATLRLTPQDVISRAKIIGHYNHQQSLDEQRTSRYISHLDWFIENAASSGFCSDVYFNKTHETATRHFKSRWLEIIEEAENEQARINALLYFRETDQEIFEIYLAKLLSAIGRNPWLTTLDKLTNGFALVYELQQVERINEDVSLLDTIPFANILLSGELLLPDNAESKEKWLRHNESDIEIRIQLLGYYERRIPRANAFDFDPYHLTQWLKHYEWFAKRASESQIVSNAQNFLNRERYKFSKRFDGRSLPPALPRNVSLLRTYELQLPEMPQERTQSRISETELWDLYLTGKYFISDKLPNSLHQLAKKGLGNHQDLITLIGYCENLDHEEFKEPKNIEYYLNSVGWFVENFPDAKILSRLELVLNGQTFDQLVVFAKTLMRISESAQADFNRTHVTQNFESWKTQIDKFRGAEEEESQTNVESESLTKAAEKLLEMCNFKPGKIDFD